jgi:hypothetical protein
VVVPPEATLPNARLDPPPQMGAREAAEWAAITAGLGFDFFPKETHALLMACCMIKTQLDDVHQALAAFGPSIPEDRQGWGRYKEISKLRNQLSGQLASLATKLRLTPQSRYNRYACGTAVRRRASRPPPWAPGDEPEVEIQ